MLPDPYPHRAAQHGWVVLDLDGGTECNLARVWHTWTQHRTGLHPDAQDAATATTATTTPAPITAPMLHYVAVLTQGDAQTLHQGLASTAHALCKYAPDPTPQQRQRQQQQQQQQQAWLLVQEELHAQWPSEAGWHRLLLCDGTLSVTLCIARPPHSTASVEMLRELRLQADTIFADDCALHWDTWHIKALVRLCKRGTAIEFRADKMQAGAAPDRSAWQQQGFVFKAAPTRAGVVAEATFAPPWAIKTSRRPMQSVLPSSCAVIGAGLAGASIAHALALRGWQVTVLDQHSTPAQGASGVPAGIVAPVLSADNSIVSQLSRHGARLTLAHAQRLLRIGQDWSPSGVLTRTSTTSPCPDQAHGLHDLHDLHGLWQADAAWIKPAALVRAWLNHPRIRFMGDTVVERLQHRKSHHAQDDQPANSALWTLYNPQGQEIMHCAMVVLANAHGSAALIEPLGLVCDAAAHQQSRTLQRVYGSISIGQHAHNPSMPEAPTPDNLLRHPINGNGSLIPWLPSDAGVDARADGDQGVTAAMQWLVGATYHRDAAALDHTGAEHQANLEKLTALLPSSAQQAYFQAAAQRNGLALWSGERCVSRDRMPLLGAIAPALWWYGALASRGLSFAALCAELLAAQIGNEPWPIAFTHARPLHYQRHQLG